MRRPAHRPSLTVVAAAATASVSVRGLTGDRGADRIRAEGELTRYVPSAVPEDARARVQAVYTAAGDSIVTLHVWALREYAKTDPAWVAATVHDLGEKL